MSQVNNIIKKYNLEKDDKKLLSLKKMLHNKMGYFSKMSEFIFSQNTDLNEIENIIRLLSDVKINKPIHSFKNSESLYDYLTNEKNKRTLNKVIKSIPSKSRRNVNSKIKDLIYNNIEYSDILIDFYSKKGGTLKSEKDLYQKTIEIISDSKGSNDYKSILRKIKRKLFYLKIKDIISSLIYPRELIKLISNFSNNKYGEIVYQNGEIIIVEIKKYLLSRILGSHHWCISREKYYWNNYLNREDKVQYFIFNSNKNIDEKETMVGVTVEYNDKISNAHFKDDSSISDAENYFKNIGILKYLKGNDLNINTLEKLISYRITNLNIIFSLNNWKHLFFEYPYHSFNDFPYYRHKESMMEEYIINILIDISTNFQLYKEENILDFITELLNYRIYNNNIYINYLLGKIFPKMNFNPNGKRNEMILIHKLFFITFSEILKYNHDNFYSNIRYDSIIYYNASRLNEYIIHKIFDMISNVLIEYNHDVYYKWSEMFYNNRISTINILLKYKVFNLKNID